MKTKNKELEKIIKKYDLVGKSYDDIFKTLYENKIEDNQSTGILSYINQHYALPKSAITELSKDENVREILFKYGLVEEEIKLEVGKWYKIVNKVSGKSGNLLLGENYTAIGMGFAGAWSWFNFNNYTNNNYKITLMTPEEIKQMLIKKFEADGLKVGCIVDTIDVCESGEIFEITTNNYIYYESHDVLLCDDVYVYSKGQFAKIIQPELTLEQRMERLEKLNNL